MLNHPILRFVLVVAASCAAAGVALAQARAPLQVAESPTAWRPPTLVVAGAELPVRLRTLKVDVEVAGGVAETRVEMEFFNPNTRILEGKLQFPLAAGQVVSGFALDVDGQLRDAVPVEKARAEQVFEDIARQRVDPGLLQTTLGNNYELRVYPLPPGKSRTVVLTLLAPAGNRMQVPMGYASSVARLDASLRYASATTAPHIDSGNALGLVFQRDERGGFTARTARVDAVLPREPLVVQSSAPGRDVAEVATEERDGERFFAVTLPVDRRSAPRPLPHSVQIVWDTSGSAASRRIDRELALLDAYFQRAATTSVTLVRVADIAFPPEHFEVRRGDWSTLRRALQASIYDGASNLGAVRHDGVSAESIWFTDGLANYGAPWRLTFPVPVFAVSSAASSDPAALDALAEASGGRRIDLGASSREQAADALLSQGTQLIEATALGANEIVVESHRPTDGRIALAGRLTDRSATLTLRLRGFDGALSTRTIQVRSGQNATRLAALQWARLNLAGLEANPHVNKARIQDIGRRFGLATRETSLLVLERVDDYVRNEIEPPAPLREAYARLAATTRTSKAQSDAARLAQVVQRFEARTTWWNRDFPKDDPKAALAIASADVLRGAVGALQESRRERSVNNGATRDEARPASVMPAPAAAPMGFASRQAAAESTDAAAKKDGRTSGGAPPSTSISIALKPATGNAEWTRRLLAADAGSRLGVYLDERHANAMSVGFFLDAAEIFLQSGQRGLGLRALSNLAEMDLQNRQVLRLLGYRLQQAGEAELAVPVFERVLELAPNEPQSHRDLGLALAQAGQRQHAIERLYEVVTGRWDGRFADIDLIALNELNAIVAKSAREAHPLETSAIDSRLLRNMPLDVRVVLAWDADATDVDLHVIDPNGEEVYYGHNLSYQGGTISHDATGGYGPEEFSLRNAKPGKYRIEANFFGHRQQVLTSSTGLMLSLSSRFGTADEQERRTTMQVRSERGERVLVGEFEVKG